MKYLTHKTPIDITSTNVVLSFRRYVPFDILSLNRVNGLRSPSAVGHRVCDRTESLTHTEFHADEYRERKNSDLINLLLFT